MAKTNTLNGRPWNGADKTAWLSSVPTHTYVIGLILVIGVLLLLSGDFGRSWDMSVHEYNGRKAYDLYFGGFDVQKFRENHDNMAYGPVLDVLIQLVQDLTTDPIEKFKIRVVLEALVSLSCLIPIFLISARVLPKTARSYRCRARAQHAFVLRPCLYQSQRLAGHERVPLEPMAHSPLL